MELGGIRRGISYKMSLHQKTWPVRQVINWSGIDKSKKQCCVAPRVSCLASHRVHNHLWSLISLKNYNFFSVINFLNLCDNKYIQTSVTLIHALQFTVIGLQNVQVNQNLRYLLKLILFWTTFPSNITL